MKMKKLLVLIALPLILGGCSKNNDDENKRYPVVPAQFVNGLYRQHSANLSYLAEYKYTSNYSSNPEYIIHGENAAEYVEEGVSTTVGVYSGVFVASTKTTKYVGNRTDAGTKTQTSSTDYFWFEKIDESSSTRELVKRSETIDKDLQKSSEDVRLAVYMDASNVPAYFSGAINDSLYNSYFTYKISPLIGSTSVQKDNSTIVSTTYSCLPDPVLIKNPDYPDNDEMSLVAFNESKTSTTFRLIDGIGWVGTNFVKEESKFVATDNKLRLSSSRINISTRKTEVNYTYAKSLMVYTGALSYKEHDANNENFKPTMYSLGTDGSSVTPMNAVVENITNVYHYLNPSYEGYAYRISNIHLEADKKYSFATAVDAQHGTFETIAYNELIDNASGFIVSGGLEGHNSIRTLDASYAYEFVILVNANGQGNLIARFSSSIN